MKTCYECKKELPDSAFTKNVNTCKKCRAKIYVNGYSSGIKKVICPYCQGRHWTRKKNTGRYTHHPKCKQMYSRIVNGGGYVVNLKIGN